MLSIQDLFQNVRSSSTRLYTRVAGMIGILFAITLPVILLTNGGKELTNLPWFLWVAIVLIVLLVIGAGIVKFRQVSHHAADISINPDQRGNRRKPQ